MSVRVNISGQFPSRSEIQGMIKKTTSTLKSAFANQWKNEAMHELKGKAGSYVEGISEDNDGVSLSGNVPEMIEGGKGAYDMKPFFAKSAKRKASKDGGWYLDIPFKASRVPPGIQKIVKDLPLEREVTDGLATRQIKFDELPKYHQRRTTRQTLINTVTSQVFPAYKRKNPIFEAVRRVQEHGGGQHFSTFRRVSDKSAPNSWIHPGFPGKGGIAEKALHKFNAQMIVNRIMTEYLKNL